jgi:NAD(P)-dependent dehydrogenase (short-subunit alcohol dehydrogenase family)
MRPPAHNGPASPSPAATSHHKPDSRRPPNKRAYFDSAAAGRLVTVYSNPGDRQQGYVSAFAAAKAGIARLTESLACEPAGTPVTVLGIHPGFVRTPMSEHLVFSPTAAHGGPTSPRPPNSGGSQGPPSWHVYRIEPRSATMTLATEPGGLTRFRF